MVFIVLVIGMSGCAYLNPKPVTPTIMQGESGTSDVSPAKTTSVPEVVKQEAPKVAQKENVIYPGTGKFVKSPKDKGGSVKAKGDITLNFENTDLREVVSVILGDLLKVNYIIDPAVRGGVSMQTGRPLSKDLLLPTLETLLRMNGAAVVQDHQGAYHVVPLVKATQGMLTPQLADAMTPLPNGYSVQIVPLKYIAAAEMSKILEPFATKGSVVRTDVKRNLLLLAGDRQQLRYLMETIETFDVDWIAGLSVGFFSLNYTDVGDILKDLDTILMGETGEMLDGLVKVVPITSANGILVVTPRAKYLKEVGKWITRLDQMSAEDGLDERLYVYRVKNGDAENLAKLLTELLKKDKKKETRQAAVAPGLKAKTVSTKAQTAGKKQSTEKKSTPKPAAVRTAGLDGVSSLDSSVKIVADTEKNTLLIMATARDYQKLESVLKTLDIVPLQVHVEATIVEITLSGDLQYGLQWYFNTSHGSMHGIGSLDGTLDSSSSSGLGSYFPGFNWSIIDSADQVRAVLSAFAGDTTVNVLSAPSVMVLDNHEATIQVGDQVPVATQQQQNTDSTSSVINSIQYRDTGVMLKVKPRVNPGGLVTMEINQEVSSVSKTDSSNLDSPTIQTRKISSTVAINSGEAVVLGGLIRDEGSEGQSGIPVLYQLPVIGNLFGETSKTSRRTELVVVLTPRVIASSADARRVTEDFRNRMQGLKNAF